MEYIWLCIHIYICEYFLLFFGTRLCDISHLYLTDVLAPKLAPNPNPIIPD